MVFIWLVLTDLVPLGEWRQIGSTFPFMFCISLLCEFTNISICSLISSTLSSELIQNKIITCTTIVVTLTILEMSRKSSSFVSGERSGADSFGPTCCENLHYYHHHNFHHIQHNPNPHCCLHLLHHHRFDFHSQKIPQISKELPIMLWSFPRQFWLFIVYFGLNLFSVENFSFPRWDWDFCRVRDCFIVKISRQAAKLLFGAHR